MFRQMPDGKRCLSVPTRLHDDINTRLVSSSSISVLHVATLNRPVQSGLSYGPIETVIYNIDKGLHALGHRSIVACTADSMVTGEHFATIDKAFGEYCGNDTPTRRQLTHKHLSMALERACRGDIDIIHLHDADAVELFYPCALRLNIPLVLTLHVSAQESGLAQPPRQWLNLNASPKVTCVAISGHQQRRYQHLISNAPVIHHGLDLNCFPVKPGIAKSDYLFTIGRITRDKGQDKAIELAHRTGRKLIIAGCVQNKSADRDFFKSIQASIDLRVVLDSAPANHDYYERVIRPLIDCDKQIIYIGELSGEHKVEWYRHASATIFPIQWDEPFGLVLIESMACETPVIAFDRGAVPELIAQGKSGFIVNSMCAMVAAVDWADLIDRHECRNHVRRNFSMTRMASNYSDLYRRVIHAPQFDGPFSPVSSYAAGQIRAASNCAS